MTKRLFVILGALVLLAMVFLPGFIKLQELREKNREMIVKIKRLNIENALLQLELKRVQDDPVYQEKIAREKMGVVRKGEIPIKIISSDRD